MHDVTASIEFQMSLLLFAALAGYLLASRVGQPAVVGEILIGLLIGPSLLGFITYSGFVSNVAHLGAIILLFVVGLEFKLKEIVNLRYGIIALFGVVVPWLGGFLLARAFEFEMQQALLIGVALTATSIAITADTLRELGRLHTPAARAIIGAAVIDDILALMALSIARQSGAGELEFGVLFLMMVKAGAFLIVGAALGQLLLTRLLHRVDASRLAVKYPELVFIFTIMTAFLYAMGAELMGLSAIVGAFVAGVSLEGLRLRVSMSFKEGAEYLRIVFGAVFFTSLGVLADLHVLDLSILWFALALTLVALATKLVGCGLSARLLGMAPTDAWVVGVGMAPRGEVAMVVALLALNERIIQQPLFLSLVIMSLLTTIVVPLVLRNGPYKKDRDASTEPSR